MHFGEKLGDAQARQHAVEPPRDDLGFVGLDFADRADRKAFGGNDGFAEFAGCRKRIDFGYARVSKSETQDTASQIRALKDAGCTRLFEEAASGGRWERPELHKMLDQLRSGDTLFVCEARAQGRVPGLKQD
jgi:hypothetical protein